MVPLDQSAVAAILEVDVPSLLRPIIAVTHDSRAVVPGGAFVAINGFTSKSSDFIPQALANGATLIVAEEPIEGAPTAVVPSDRIALAALATEIAGHPSRDLTVYGITGTNGKTTSSYVLHAILTAAHGGQATGLMTSTEIIVGTEHEMAIRTTGEATQVQANLARMRETGVQHVVLETSSHGIHLHRVDGTHYTAALFTNLTRDHLDLHGTMEDYYLTKQRLFEWSAGPKLANADDAYGVRLATEIDSTLTFGFTKGADYRIRDERTDGSHTVFNLDTPAHRSLTLTIPLLGTYNVHNVAGAAGVALEMGITANVLINAVREMSQVPGRFERVPAAIARGFEVIVDYAHTDIGLRAVLEVARKVAGDRQVICVYGATGDRDRDKRSKMGMVASEFADHAIITTDDAYTEEPATIADEVYAGANPQHTEIIIDRRTAIDVALRQAKLGDIVVVAGKGHERVQHLPTGDIPFHDMTVVREWLEAG